MKHCFILWTRPEIIKCYSCIKYAEEHGLDFFIIHSNQHYSENMDKIFFEELWLPQPRYNLWVNWWWHGSMTWRMLIEIEKILLEEKPDVVYVQWDTNTVLAWWLVASKMGIKVAHIEAWLRSYDRTMPEEINRVCVDHISDYLFAPTEKQKWILLKEWIEENKIFVVWNTIVDAVLWIKEKNKDLNTRILEKYGLHKDWYFLLTTHRPSNVDWEESLRNILEWINYLKELTWKEVLFPIHPRTKNNIEKFWLSNLLSNIKVIEPVWFIENVIFESNSYMIVTDSWGIQEEWCILEKKTLVLRENTERPETLEVWWAILVWNSEEKLISSFNVLRDKVINWYNPFWDGKTAQHIFNITECVYN